jgi:hypothetical protein
VAASGAELESGLKEIRANRATSTADCRQGEKKENSGGGVRYSGPKTLKRPDSKRPGKNLLTLHD